MNKVKSWMKKYSMQMAALTSIAGVVVSVMPQFEMYLPQWATGAIMSACGIITALARVWPQEEV